MQVLGHLAHTVCWRSKLTGSVLGIRRANEKLPPLQGWRLCQQVGWLKWVYLVCLTQLCQVEEQSVSAGSLQYMSCW